MQGPGHHDSQRDKPWLGPARHSSACKVVAAGRGEPSSRCRMVLKPSWYSRRPGPSTCSSANSLEKKGRQVKFCPDAVASSCPAGLLLPFQKCHAKVLPDGKLPCSCPLPVGLSAWRHWGSAVAVLWYWAGCQTPPLHKLPDITHQPVSWGGMNNHQVPPPIQYLKCQASQLLQAPAPIQSCQCQCHISEVHQTLGIL